MGDQAYLSEEDVRAVVNLLGKVAVVEGDHRAKKRFLVEGLAKIVNADVWWWGLIAWGGRVQTPVPFWMIDGGWTSPEQKNLFLQWPSDPEYGALIVSHFIPIGQHLFTRTRRQILPNVQWYGSGFYQRWMPRAGLDDFLAASYPVGHNASGQPVFSALWFYRQQGQPPFTARDRCIVHLVWSEIDWLHRAGTDVPAAQYVADLPPRLYQVMLLLLAGDSVKQIAYKLELSQNTIKDYMKQLHKRFGVSSRGELLAQFLSGDAAVKHADPSQSGAPAADPKS